MATETRPATVASPPPWREVFSGARGRLTAGLLLLEALVAIEALIVAVILPAVERDLGGLSLYGWTFTAFTLASLATVPIAGRLIDRVGPRRGARRRRRAVRRRPADRGRGPVDDRRRARPLRAGHRRRRDLHRLARRGREDLPGPDPPARDGAPRVDVDPPGAPRPDPREPASPQTIGWRWAFLAPIPAIVLGVLLVIPALGGIGAEPSEERLPVVAGLLTMVGAGLVLAGLTRLRMDDRDPGPGRARRRPAGAPRITPRGTLRRPARAPRRLGGRVPGLVRVPRRRRLHHADAHAGPRPLDRAGGAHRDGREHLVGGGELVPVARRRPARREVAHDRRRARHRDGHRARGGRG